MFQANTATDASTASALRGPTFRRKDLGEQRPELAVSDAAALAQLHGLAQRQMRVGQRHAVDRCVDLSLQDVVSLLQFHDDAVGSEGRQVSVETAHVYRQAP